MLRAALCITANSDCQCLLWVKSGHRSTSIQCPLYPQKQTFIGAILMSALCQKQTSTSENGMRRSETAVALIRAVRLFSSTVGTYPGQPHA